jgi:hypothetical protein
LVFSAWAEAGQLEPLGAEDIEDMKPVLTAAFLLVAMAPSIQACICVCEGKPRSVQEQVRDSSAVVVAEVIEKIELETVTPEGDRWTSSCAEEIVRFRVVRTLKAETTSEIFARHAGIGTGCDVKFTFEKGRRYLVFLRGGECPAIDGCGDSRPADQATELIERIAKLSE